MSCRTIAFNKTEDCCLINKETKEKKNFIKMELYFKKEHYTEILHWVKKRNINIGILFGEAVSAWIESQELEEERLQLEKKFKDFSKSKKN